MGLKRIRKIEDFTPQNEREEKVNIMILEVCSDVIKAVKESLNKFEDLKLDYGEHINLNCSIFANVMDCAAGAIQWAHDNQKNYGDTRTPCEILKKSFENVQKERELTMPIEEFLSTLPPGVFSLNDDLTVTEHPLHDD